MSRPKTEDVDETLSITVVIRSEVRRIRTSLPSETISRFDIDLQSIGRSINIGYPSLTVINAAVAHSDGSVFLAGSRYLPLTNATSLSRWQGFVEKRWSSGKVAWRWALKGRGNSSVLALTDTAGGFQVGGLYSLDSSVGAGAGFSVMLTGKGQES
jgi:hypothetical protein